LDQLTDHDVAGTCLSEQHGAGEGGLMAKINALIDRANDVTLAEMDIYVDPDNGDDENNGAMVSPFATITRAYDAVPHTIKHAVHIHIRPGTYTDDFPYLIDNAISPQGSLSFDGSGSFTTVDAGPYEAGTVTDLTVYGTTADVAVVGGGLTANEFQGKFVRWLDGSAAGTVSAVISNTTSVIRLKFGWTKAALGDEFEVVEPAVNINITDEQVRLISPIADTRSTVNIHLALAGLKMSIDKLRIQNAQIGAAGSIFETDDCDIRRSEMVGGMSYADNVDDLLDDPTITQAWNGTFLITAKAGATQYLNLMDCYMLGNVAILRSVDVQRGATALNNMSILTAGNYAVDAYTLVASLRAWELYIEVPATKDGIKLNAPMNAELYNIYVAQARYAIYQQMVGNCTVEELSGADASVDNAFYVTQGGHIAIDNSSCTLVGKSGASNAIKWKSAAANSPYPAANNVVEDSLGAQVVGY
jgi:hypothetical protein